MENRKDIGKAFNEKLSALNQAPNEKVWQNIHAELEKKKKRRFAFIFFWSVTIGFILLGLSGGYYFYNQNSGFEDSPKVNSPETTVVNDETKNRDNNRDLMNQNNDNPENEQSIKSEKSIINENSGNDKNADKNEKSSNDIESATTNSKTTKAVSEKSSFKRNSKSAKKLNTFKKKTYGISKSKNSTWSKKSKSKKVKSTEKETIRNQNLDVLKDSKSALADNSSEKNADVKKKKTDTIAAKKPKEKEININMFPKDSVQKDSAKIYKKFYIDAFASPTLYGYFGKESTIDRRLDSLSKNSKIKFSYGVGLTYDLTEKISVRIGYSRVNINYVTKNVPINTSNYSGISYNPNVSNATILAASNGSEKMDVTQRISYTEIPLEVKYTFLDKKIGLKSSFGFSYLLLNENKVSIKTLNGFSQDIGKTEKLSPTSISVNLGIEADYPLFKNTKIFVEPMFNYQVKAFSDGNYKPYIFGIHTGIRYSLNNK